ncbi:MAG: hypothetical protein HQK65_22525, partial [Desulfamplus sp.]|nr:hypothetical protein [Desulfamplus sp.]
MKKTTKKNSTAPAITVTGHIVESFVIPKEEKNKLKFISEKIYAAFELPNNGQRHTIEMDWSIGKWFNIAKILTNDERREFGIFCKKYFPTLPAKRRQYCMNLAKKINIEKFPIFTCLEKKSLVGLIQIANNQTTSVKRLLRNNDIKVKNV